jgi:hypothetical protein
MVSGGWIRFGRRHRLAIGLIAAYAFLLSALLPAFAAAADPLQAYLADHLCGPGDPAKGGAPTGPAEHQHDCQLCGPSCPMGGHAPLAALPDGLGTIPAYIAVADMPVLAGGDAPSPSSRYPSDILSQGPPQAA